jgi:hypothetical protein
VRPRLLGRHVRRGADDLVVVFVDDKFWRAIRPRDAEVAFRGRRLKMAHRNPRIRARSAGPVLAVITGMQMRIGVAFWMVFAAAGCDSSADAVAETPTDSGRDSTFEVGSGGQDSGPDLADAVNDVVAPHAKPDAEAGVDGDADAGGDAPCLGVCASGPPFGCARTYATADCYGHTCCELPDDGGPPVLDGSCPMCASPDDIGCPGTWYRSASCPPRGVLCCGPGLPGHGTDGG